MAQQVGSGQTYPSGENYTNYTNTRMVPIWVCDCHCDRRVFTDAAAVEHHEWVNATYFSS